MLVNFDIENIAQKQIDKVIPLTASQDFNFDAQRKNGGCTAYLTEWVNKVIEHHNLYLLLKPNMAKQE